MKKREKQQNVVVFVVWIPLHLFWIDFDSYASALNEVAARIFFIGFSTLYEYLLQIFDLSKYHKFGHGRFRVLAGKRDHGSPSLVSAFFYFAVRSENVFQIFFHSVPLDFPLRKRRKREFVVNVRDRSPPRPP